LHSISSFLEQLALIETVSNEDVIELKARFFMEGVDVFIFLDDDDDDDDDDDNDDLDACLIKDF